MQGEAASGDSEAIASYLEGVATVFDVSWFWKMPSRTFITKSSVDRLVLLLGAVFLMT